MTEPPPFVYDPLPAGYIRLLTPTSSETADGHIWKLQTLALDQKNLEFDALSYVWGSASELLDIYLDGYVAQVHRNLHTALPYLARRGDVRPVRPIWIDAICINQADHEEKMAQIREMNRVYKQAKKVWVWLGTTKYQERIPDALRFLKELAEYKRSRQFEGIDDEEERLNLESVEMPLRLALYHIVSNDWFGRLWVIQEAALAQDLSFLCGSNECSWDILNDALKDGSLWTCLKHEVRRCQDFAELCDESVQIESSKKYGKGTIFSIRIIVKIWRSAKDVEAVNAQALMLAITMLISCSHICLNPEDRVLGLLGLVDAEVLRRTCLDPEVAYVSVEDLFTRATRFVFAFAAPPDRAYLWEWLRSAFKVDKRTGLPSWVPDFHSPGLRTLGPVEFECDRPSRYAAVNKVLCSRGGLGSDELVLTGTVVDEVVTAFEMIPCPSPGQYLYRAQERGLLIAVANWESMIANDALGQTSIDSEAWRQPELGNHRNLQGYWKTLVNNQKNYMDEVISHDWYLDFQAMARRLEGIMVDAATQKYASLVGTGPCHYAYGV